MSKLSKSARYGIAGVAILALLGGSALIYRHLRPHDAKFYQRDAAGAVALLNRGHTAIPNNPQIVELLAQAYRQNGDMASAIALLQNSTSIYPKDEDARWQLAATKYAIGQFGAPHTDAAALLASDKGLQIAGSSFVAGALQHGMNDDAGQVAAAMAKRFPDNPTFQELLASLHFASKDMAGGEKILEAVLARWPDEKAARDVLSRAYFSDKRPADAEKLYTDFLARHPNDIDSLRALSRLYAGSQDYTNAMKMITQARTVAPNDPAVALDQLRLLETQKKWDDAKLAASNMTLSFPNDAEIRDASCRILAEAGDLDGARAAFRDAVPSFPTNAGLWWNDGITLRNAKDYPAALNAHAHAIAYAPNNGPYLGGMAQLAVLKDKAKFTPAAQQIAAHNAQADRDDRTVVASQILILDGQKDGAVQLLQDTMKQRPSQKLTLGLANAYLAQSQPLEATSALEDWNGKHPHDAAIEVALAQAYMVGGLPSQAAQQYELLLVDNPKAVPIMNNLAYVYLELGDPRALALAHKAYDLSPKTPEVADTLGWVELHQGDARDSVKILKTASEARPDDRDIHFHYAASLLATGDKAGAISALQAILADNAPFSERASAQQLLNGVKAPGGKLPGKS